MTTTDRASATSPASTGGHAGGVAPWSGLVVLAMVTFTVVTGELLPTAVLSQMSAALGVPRPQVGLLVSVWAAVVVLASLPSVRLTKGRDRRRVIAGALGVFGGASLLTAMAPTFPLAVATLGSVLGVPLAAAAGQRWGWRVPFVALLAVFAGALPLAGAAGLAVTVRRLLPQPGMAGRRHRAPTARPASAQARGRCADLGDHRSPGLTAMACTDDHGWRRP